MKKQIHVFVSGRVQGVFYRASAQIHAQKLGLSGFARNLPDGRVEIVAQGDSHTLEKLVDWCRHGPTDAQVSDIQLTEEQIMAPIAGFDIRH